jgi:hypothetical protein
VRDSFGVSFGDNDEPSGVCKWSLGIEDLSLDKETFLEEVARTYGLPLVARWSTVVMDNDDGDGDKTAEERASEALAIQTMAILFVCAMSATPQYDIHPTALSVRVSQEGHQEDTIASNGATTSLSPVSCSVAASALSASFGFLADDRPSRWD